MTSDLRQKLEAITKGVVTHYANRWDKQGTLLANHDYDWFEATDAILDAVIESLPEESLGNAYSYNRALKDIKQFLIEAKGKK